MVMLSVSSFEFVFILLFVCTCGCLPVTTHIPINMLLLICVVCSDITASVESLQCIQILQTYGANFGVKSVHGATPMHKAAASRYVGPSVCLCTFDLWILVVIEPSRDTLRTIP